MSNKPVFVATHPRACSTAFERVFMTRRKDVQTIHEPFGDAYYFGPERMGARFEDDEKARIESGYSESTFKSILDSIENEAAEGKRVFIKDITHYLVPPADQKSCIAPSLSKVKRGVGTGGMPVIADNDIASVESKDNGSDGGDSGVMLQDGEQASQKCPPFPYANATSEPNNPTVIPHAVLEKFHFTFLIRHPRSSIPSYYRCTIPPLVERTGFPYFMPEEAGYSELRRVFDYLKDTGLIGPKICTHEGPDAPQTTSNGVEICVVDADDMLDDPEGILRKYCESIGMEFDPEMLKWDSEEAHDFAKSQFEKWRGFHDDAINSTDLKPRTHKKAPKSDEQLYEEWSEKYGKEAADLIKKTVDDNVADYEYLKQFAVKA